MHAHSYIRLSVRRCVQAALQKAVAHGDMARLRDVLKVCTGLDLNSVCDEVRHVIDP